MYPDLFTLELAGRAVTVPSYTFFAVAAAITVTGLSFLLAVRRGLPRPAALACLLTAAAFFPVGARLFHIAASLPLYLQKPHLLLHLAGFSLWGGLLAAAAAGYLSCRFWRVDLWRLADAAAPALGLGIAAARIGCLLNGCCHGKATSLPWGITLNSAAVHPTQLYELTAALAGSALALWLLRRGAGSGVAFLSFFTWFTGWHWLISCLRAPAPHQSLPQWFSTAFFAALLLTGAALLLIRLRAARLPASDEAPPETANL